MHNKDGYRGHCGTYHQSKFYASSCAKCNEIWCANFGNAPMRLVCVQAHKHTTGCAEVGFAQPERSRPERSLNADKIVAGVGVMAVLTTAIVAVAVNMSNPDVRQMPFAAPPSAAPLTTAAAAAPHRSSPTASVTAALTTAPTTVAPTTTAVATTVVSLTTVTPTPTPTVAPTVAPTPTPTLAPTPQALAGEAEFNKCMRVETASAPYVDKATMAGMCRAVTTPAVTTGAQVCFHDTKYTVKPIKSWEMITSDDIVYVSPAEGKRKSESYEAWIRSGVCYSEPQQ